MAQNLQAADKRKIEGLYLSDVKPSEIARQLGKKPASIRQYIYRTGLSKRRNEIEVAKKLTSREVLEIVRQRHVEELGTVLGMTAEGLKIDAGRLRNGWDMVEGAADASALMRAKSMHLDQVFRFHGVEKPEAERSGSVNVMFVGSLPRLAARQVSELPREN